MEIQRYSIFCPYCHKYTSIDPARTLVRRSGWESFEVDTVWQQSERIAWWIGVCNCCNNAVLVLNNMGKMEKVYPRPLPKPTDDHVPEDIRTDLDEAKQCFAVSAWRAVAVMARRAMQSAAIEKGAAEKDRLVDQITDLADQGKITADLKDWADMVRWVGNDAAHSGGQPVTQEDADDVLKLAEQFLYVLYVTPAIAKQLRTKKNK